MFEEARYTQTSAPQTQKISSNNTRYFEPTRNNIRDTVPSEFLVRPPHLPSWRTDNQGAFKTGAKLMVQCLEAQKVRFIFGQLRDRQALLHQALQQSSIQLIPTRHSREAIAMARVYSRCTGQVSVCLTTSMQSTLNALPAIAEANLNNSPLILITELPTNESLPKEPQDHLHLNHIITPAIQGSYQISHPDDTSKIVHKAFIHSDNGIDGHQPGVVHINLPATTAISSTFTSPLHLNQQKTLMPNAKQLNQAASWISRGHNAIILVGSGATQPEVKNQVIALATQLQIPVVHTFMAKGIIRETHPLSVGPLSSAKDYSHYGFDWADVVITIGCNASEGHPQYWNPDGDIPTLHIGKTAAEMTPHYHPNLELVGDISEILGAILHQTKQPDNHKTKSPKAYSLDITVSDQDTKEISIPYTPQDLVQVLRTLLKPEDILLSDNGIHREWFLHRYPCELPTQCLLFHKSAATELILSGAIAAKLTHQQHNVIAVTGADGFMKSYAALEPAQWLKTPFVTLICNQGGYYPNFTEIAKGMGFRGYRLTSSEALLPLVKDALTQPMPVIIDCPMDY